jgi:hypothetical protein
MLDIRVHDVQDLALIARESQAVLVRLQRADALPAAELGAHGHLLQTGHALVLDADELSLYHQIFLLWVEYMGNGEVS